MTYFRGDEIGWFEHDSSMVKRILLGLTGAIGTLALVGLGFGAGFLLGALPIGALYAAHLIGGGVTDTLLPLLGLALGGTGVALAVRTCRRLPGWIHHRRLPEARQRRAMVEAEVTGSAVRYTYYRGASTWSYRVELSWKDPVTGEPERIRRRYTFHNRKRADAFRDEHTHHGTKIPLLVQPGHPQSAIVDIPNGPVWTELW